MAASKLIAGVLREVWQEAAGQAGGPPQVIVTKIRIETGSLSRVRGQLVIDGVVGPATPSAGAYVSAGGFLEIRVFNGAGGTSMTWTLDVQLTHSSQQARDPLPGAYIPVVYGAGVGGGIPAAQNLFQTYNFGAAAIDQTMVIDDTTKGGAVIVDASTAAVTGAATSSFEILQNAAHEVPMVVRRAGNIVAGPTLQFNRMRGTLAAPVALIADDIAGTINFTAFMGGFGTLTAGQIQVPVLTVSEGGLSTAIDYSIADYIPATTTKVWRMDHPDLSRCGRLIGYGVEDSATSAILQFIKGRGTLAAPTNIQTNDALGTLEFQAYAAGGYGNYAQIQCLATNVGAGPGFLVRTALDFYATYDSVWSTLFRMARSAGGGGVLTCFANGAIMPDVDNQGQIGSPVAAAWASVAAYNFYAQTNVNIGDYVAGGAVHTLILANNSTMPAPTANKVYIGSTDFVFGANHAVVDISAEELVVVSAQDMGSHLIPLRYNGISYYLLAIVGG